MKGKKEETSKYIQKGKYFDTTDKILIREPRVTRCTILLALTGCRAYDENIWLDPENCFVALLFYQVTYATTDLTD